MCSNPKSNSRSNTIKEVRYGLEIYKRMILGVRSLVMCMKKYILREVNILNESQYLEGLISIVTQKIFTKEIYKRIYIITRVIDFIDSSNREILL